MPATASPATASLAESRDARGRNRAPQNRPKALQAQRRLATGLSAADDPGAAAAQDRYTRKAPSIACPIPASFPSTSSPVVEWIMSTAPMPPVFFNGLLGVRGVSVAKGFLRRARSDLERSC